MKKLVLTILFLVLFSFPTLASEATGETDFNQMNFYYNNGSTPVPQTVSNIFYDQGKNPLDDYYFNIAYYLENGTYTETKLTTVPEDASLSLGFYLSVDENQLNLNYDGSSFTDYKIDELYPDFQVASASILARPNVIGEDKIALSSAGINVYPGDLPTAQNLTGLSFGPVSPGSPRSLVKDDDSYESTFPYPSLNVNNPGGIYWSIDGNEYTLNPLFLAALNQDLISFVSSDETILSFENKLGGFQLHQHGRVDVTLYSNLNGLSSLDVPDTQLGTFQVIYEESHGQSDFIDVNTDPTDIKLDYDPNAEQNILPVEILFSPLEAVNQKNIFITTGDLNVASVQTSILDNEIISTIYANGPGTTQLIINYSFFNTLDEEIYATKEFPITVIDNEIVPEQIITSADNVYLTTKSNLGYSLANVSATLIPNTSAGQIYWGSSNPAVASVSSQTGNEVIIQANSPGIAIIEAVYYPTAEECIKDEINVFVNDGDVILDSIEITGASPDFYQITAKNVRINPAYFNQDQEPVSQVSMFTWSTPDQSDMDCKVASQIGNDWTYTFPVNNTPVNNFYINADKIIVNIYGSNIEGSNGNFIGATTYKTVNENTASDNTVAYISYAKNDGFLKPTVFDGDIAGSTGQNLPLEGFRISSNVEGIGINAAVHVQDYGWQSPVSDGTYAGTMFENKNIEALQLTLSGPNQYSYQLSYRVHVQDIGWTDWVLPRWFNQYEMWAGTVGQNKAIEAIQVVLLPR